MLFGAENSIYRIQKIYAKAKFFLKKGQQDRIQHRFCELFVNALQSRTIVAKTSYKTPYDISRESNVSAHTLRRQPRSGSDEKEVEDGSGGRGSCIPTCTYSIFGEAQRSTAGISIDYRIRGIPLLFSILLATPQLLSRFFDRICQSFTISVCAAHPRYYLQLDLHPPGAIITSTPRPLLHLLAIASFYIRSPIDRARSEAFKLLCLSRDIAFCLLPIRFARIESGVSLFPRGYHYQSNCSYYCVCHYQYNAFVSKQAIKKTSTNK